MAETDALCEGEGIYIYSCVTNHYDLIFPPVRPKTPAKFILFSDTPAKSGAWMRLPLSKDFNCDVSSNRFHKFFPHILFPNADYSIYVDGNIGIIGDISPLIEEFIDSRAALGLFFHKDRCNVREEVDACLQKGKFSDACNASWVDQISYMRAQGMPEDQRLTDNAVIFRWHKHAKLGQTMDDWWGQFNSYTKRDQISLPFSVWKNETPTKIWEWSFRAPNIYFQKYPHRGPPLRNLRCRVRNAMMRFKAKFVTTH